MTVRTILKIFEHPARFALQVLQGFGRNQGLLLAGAIAYYALLSVVPLLILCVVGLSHFVAQADLLATLRSYLDWLVPTQSEAVLSDVSGFLDSGVPLHAVLLVTMMFFGSLAFSVLEKAMAVIFARRSRSAGRHALISAILPYCFAMLLGIALLATTVLSVTLQTISQESVSFLGRAWSLRGPSGVLLYLLALVVQTAILSAFYWIMPVGRTKPSHALVGGFAATTLWEGVRHVLIWYFSTLSKASVVYGSLTTAVVALFGMEIAATVLLLGAQVIAEYESLEASPA